MSKLLTDAELELMAIIWQRGPSTTRELLSALDDGRAYTTVSTLLRILVDKGFLKTQPEGRSHRYAPLVAQADYQGRGLSHVVAGLFGGDALGLVRRLVRSEQLDEGQLADLRAMVDRELGEASSAGGAAAGKAKKGDA